MLENGNYEGKKRVGKLKSLEKSKLGLNRLATKTEVNRLESWPWEE